MRKEIFWQYEGKRYEGFANWEKDCNLIDLCDEKHFPFSVIHEEDIEGTGLTLADIWEMIPEDITDFEFSSLFE